MITMAFFVLGGILIAAYAVLSMIRGEREKRRFNSSITDPRPRHFRDDDLLFWERDE